MVEVKELEWKKRDELCKGISQQGISIEEARIVLNYLEDECLIEITPPQVGESVLQMIKIKDAHTGRFEGKSYKPGNIILNIKEAAINSLAFASSAVASIAAISTSQPIIASFTILSTVLSAAVLGEIKLDDNAVLILAVLWENRHIYNQFIEADAGLEIVNDYLESYDREKLSRIQYNDLLADLEKVKSIDLNDGKIKLVEKICIEY